VSEKPWQMVIEESEKMEEHFVMCGFDKDHPEQLTDLRNQIARFK